jgi:hypothetical protein
MISAKKSNVLKSCVCLIPNGDVIVYGDGVEIRAHIRSGLSGVLLHCWCLEYLGAIENVSDSGL